MNVFGLNSATLNGSTYAVVFGAALAVAGASIQAVPTNTRPGGNLLIAVTPTVAADGLRTVRPTALAAIVSTASSDGVFATSASATGTGGATLRVTNTEALSLPKSTNSAAGTIVRPGAGVSIAYSTGTADALLIQGNRVDHIITARISVDPSVKRSGQATTEREGYAWIEPGVRIAASAERSARGFVEYITATSAAAEPTHTIGASALIECACGITALAAHDVAACITTSTATAMPTLYAMASASASSSAVTQSGSTVQQQGVCELVDVRAIATAAERMAALGQVAHLAGATISATGRLAILVEAKTGFTSNAEAYANAIRAAHSALAVSLDVAAIGTRICMGEASAIPSVDVRATAMSNPAVPAPFERSMRIPSEDRAFRLAYEDRSMRVV